MRKILIHISNDKKAIKGNKGLLVARSWKWLESNAICPTNPQIRSLDHSI